MKKMTPAVKRKIEKDWIKELPYFKIHRTFLLLKRNGPILVGLHFKKNRENDWYTPRFFLHNLCSAFPEFSLTCGVSVDFLKATEHERGDYINRIEALREKIPFISEKELKFSQAFELYVNVINKKETVYPLPLLHDLITLSYYGDYKKYAQTILQYVYDLIPTWGPGVRKIDRDEWRSRVLEVISSRKAIESVVEQEVETHDVGKLPVYDLEFDKEPYVFW